MSLREENVQPNRYDGGADVTRSRAQGADLAALIQELSRKENPWNKDAADAMASTATAEHAISRSGLHTRHVASVEFIPDAALTGDDTNNAVLTVRRRTAAAADGGIVAQLTTTVAEGNWVAFIPQAFVITAANQLVAATDSLTVEITKGGTGVAVPAGQLVVHYE